jgi:uncharacterized membrane protein SirB2
MCRVLLALHVCAVAVSVGLYGFRAIRSLLGCPIERRSWLGILPHAVDTALLLSAIGLMSLIHQYPFAEPWLTAKFVAVSVYIGLGSWVVRGRGPRWGQVTAFIGSLLVVTYIVGVAVRHSPIPF